MSERSIFDADAISSAIIAYHSCDEHLISDAAKAALRAAEASLEARGKIFRAGAYFDAGEIEANSAWVYSDPGLQAGSAAIPVAIIKLSEGK